MRSLRRSIARHLMEMHGVDQINKKKHWKSNRTGRRKSLYQKQNDGKMVSFFSLHWKEYLDPESNYRKDLERQLKLEAIRQTRACSKPVKASWPVPR